MENSLELNQWHYVGASYDDFIGNASLWINGTRVKQKNFGDGLTLASDVFDVKRMVSGINFKGRISAMQVYNYSLTSEDINALKYATFGPDCIAHAGPIAIYPLNSQYTTQEIDNLQPTGNAKGVSLADGLCDQPDGSYQFHGSNDSYITFPNNGSLYLQHSITMLCWVYFSNPTSGPFFVYYNKTDIAQFFEWVLVSAPANILTDSTFMGELPPCRFIATL
ncbi:hypothetical protein OS493_034643 [Desmophyllum pertusum]|uniref:LamG domain-containing protein n=1 Tax=Desmophyllum pertusum TaxID=174260 RepID=A0A9X0D0B3_9CNID|nr:hypothetical protein OS493_034643 [Desmophyllum pertusum]